MNSKWFQLQWFNSEIVTRYYPKISSKDFNWSSFKTRVFDEIRLEIILENHTSISAGVATRYMGCSKNHLQFLLRVTINPPRIIPASQLRESWIYSGSYIHFSRYFSNIPTKHYSCSSFKHFLSNFSCKFSWILQKFFRVKMNRCQFSNFQEHKFRESNFNSNCKLDRLAPTSEWSLHQVFSSNISSVLQIYALENWSFSLNSPSP